MNIPKKTRDFILKNLQSYKHVNDYNQIYLNVDNLVYSIVKLIEDLI